MKFVRSSFPLTPVEQNYFGKIAGEVNAVTASLFKVYNSISQTK
jgi:hypothetical protein